ncbi:zinc finger CCHC domain-containing protein 24-like [Pollicipes pollicipes]|uniref:zinc finger CCHC domain-containing protein 24-like n=1 Tax=Pollicipes pollicipes TaxID=41117 RepID=UPI001884FDB6|nr:zinc finger CCHC domain-containing protein 24-like [Pollicipes pollicipes]XP_037072091.1 zinc finger CCHC domain-containing protein 24-like [Pollicipes pollicipes]
MASGSHSDAEDGLMVEFASLQLQDKPDKPPKHYRCGVCHEIGQHFINFCPQALKTGVKTPYQGKRRAFGEYQCCECRRLWQSSRSWANMAQECQSCRIRIYPHRQTPLHKPGGLDKIDQDKKHPAELCEKCTKLGYSCVLHNSKESVASPADEEDD